MRPRVVILTSSAPRHRYFVGAVSSATDAALVLRQDKRPPRSGPGTDSELLRTHFRRLTEAEDAEFLPRLKNARDVAMRTADDINDSALPELAKASGAEAVCLFGTAILKSQWLDAFPDRIINLHLGLSPYYRGSATLFWPFVNEELECVGTTIHLAASRVDAGAIIARIKADPRVGDTYYALTNRLIRRSIDIFPDRMLRYLSGSIEPQPQDLSLSKHFKRADFNETALRQMLSRFDAGITADQIARASQSTRCSCSQ
jgi:methionyl-tRNA formyltransferase